MGEILLHILFIANCESLYGANRSMLDLAVELQKLGQDIFFFFSQQGAGKDRYKLKQELERYGFQYAFLRYSPSVHSGGENGVVNRMLRKEINKRCLLEMKYYVVNWEIDIIHTNSLTHTIGMLLGKQMKKPHVWHIRETLQTDYDLHYDNWLLYWYGLRKADRIICISDFIRNIHKKMLFGAKTITLYNGFNIENYLLDGAYKKYKNYYNLIICGVVRKEKGQFQAVKALKHLIYKYKVKNVRLQIVGDGSGGYYEQINSYIKEFKLNYYVDIIPFQDNLRQLRRNADIALVCSENEAFGRVTIESMLSENLVIGADSGGTAEIIEDGVVGYLYKEGNEEDLCEKIYNVITHWDKQEKIIQRAKEYAKINFGVVSYAKKVLSLYEGLV